MYGWCFVGEPAEMVALRIGVDLGLITIGPEYMNMMETTSSKDKTNPGEDYINLFACSTVGKRTPPPPPKLPVPKPRLNVSLSRESSMEDSSPSGRKKKPVPQPRSFPPKNSNLTSSKSASKVLIPIKNENTKIYKRYPVSTSVLPTESSSSGLNTNSLPPKSSSSSSDEELDLPPALPVKHKDNVFEAGDTIEFNLVKNPQRKRFV
jgi:hypothetical protein